MQVTIFFVAFHVAKIPQNTYSLHEISRGIHTCHQPHGNIDPPGSRTWGQYLSRGLQVWRIGKSHENPRIGKGFFQYLSIQIWNDINLHWYIYIYINICIYLYIYGYMDVYILIHIKPLQGLWLWCFISGGPAVGFGNHLYWLGCFRK